MGGPLLDPSVLPSLSPNSVLSPGWSPWLTPELQTQSSGSFQPCGGDPGAPRKRPRVWTSLPEASQGTSRSESREHGAFSFEAQRLAGTDSRDFLKRAGLNGKGQGGVSKGEPRSAKGAECAGVGGTGWAKG